MLEWNICDIFNTGQEIITGKDVLAQQWNGRRKGDILSLRTLMLDLIWAGRGHIGLSLASSG